MMKEELELYLHIPFCVRKCAYCDFLSAPADQRTRQEYVYTIIKEIQGYKEAFYDRYQISTIFLGGGTPSILEGNQIEAILTALRQSFVISEHAEITIEVNPGTVTGNKLQAWKRAGINRLSIGLQSANDEELRMLGRIHTWNQFLETYYMARKEGFDNINIDLISAIPGQTVASWTETLRKTAELNPEHLSAYSLILEEGTPFYERYVRGVVSQPQLPDEDTEREIYELTAKLLAQYGYQRYEISNYAKAGYACRHNLGYWERKNYLGIGLGASSLLGRKRFHNTADYRTYIEKIEKGEDLREDMEELTIANEAEEFMFLGLRETSGVSSQRFREIFGRPVLDVYGKQIEKLCREGLLEIEGDRIRLTEHGIDVSNAVFVDFLDPDL